MMKRYLLPLVLCLLAVGCTPEETSDNTPDLLTTHSSLTFKFRESSFPVTVRSESPWTLVSDSEWLTASVCSAEQSATIQVCVSINEGDPRFGILTLTNAKSSCKIEVMQEADTRNYLDIKFVNIPESFEKLSGAFLVIPYRKGCGVTLESVSASVIGEARGSIEASFLSNVRLEEGAGEIRLPLSGRAGAPGMLLLTVAGLPSTVYGEAAQCLVTVGEGEPVADVTIASLKSSSDGKISAKKRIRGVVTSFENGIATIQDKTGGIAVGADGPFNLKNGDDCEIFVRNCSISTVSGIRTLMTAGDSDVNLLAEGVAVDPLTVTSLDLAANQSVLCRIDACQCEETEINRVSTLGFTRMECKGYSFRTYASFDAPFSKGYGFVTGVLGTDESSEPVLKLRDASDLEGLNGERVDVNAVFELDRYAITVPAAGDDNISFKISSSVDWALSSDDDGWLSGWTRTSGAASTEAVPISVNAAPNTLGRRSAKVTFRGKGVADVVLTITQIEGKSILDQDFSLVKQSLQANPKYYPTGSSTEVSKSFADYGLDGWYAPYAYTALSKDGAYGILRIGKTLMKGYIQTPCLTEIGDTPTNIEVSLLGGKYKSCTADWIAVEIEGPGSLVAGEDLMLLEEYSDKYSSSGIENLPVWLLHDFDNNEVKRVKFKISGATSQTRIRLTSTKTGTSNAAECNMFFIGDFHVTYAD